MGKRNVLYLHSVLSHVLNALRNTITECVFLSRCFPLSLTRFHSFSCWSTLLFSLASSHSYHFPCLTSPICLFLFCPPLLSSLLLSSPLLSSPLLTHHSLGIFTLLTHQSLGIWPCSLSYCIW